MKLEKWNQILVRKAKYLMDKKYYSTDSAMNKVWNKNYASLQSKNEINLTELREIFWSKGFEELNKFNNEILRRYEDE